MKVEARYREITRRWCRIPGSRGDITSRPAELTAGIRGRSHRKRVHKRMERATKGQSQPAVTP